MTSRDFVYWLQKVFEYCAYLGWFLTIPLAIRATMKLGIWNQDVFVNGVSAGAFVAFVAVKIERFIREKL